MIRRLGAARVILAFAPVVTVLPTGRQYLTNAATVTRCAEVKDWSRPPGAQPR
jgi:hypothetical protein